MSTAADPQSSNRKGASGGDGASGPLGAAAGSSDIDAWKEKTPQERSEWLKSQGVEITDFRAANGGGPCGADFAGELSERFAFVFLPADDATEPEERLAPIGLGDSLKGFVGPTFAGTVSDETLQRIAASHGQSIGMDVGMDSLRRATKSGGAEAFRIAAPTEENGHEAVYIYLDDCGAFKQLPRNRRATDLARACGFPTECEFNGDVFVGRTRWADSGLTNVDFKLTELEPSSLWLRRAPLENLQQQAQTRPDAHAEAQAGRLTEPQFAEGEGKGYTWRDSPEEVEVVLSVREPRSKKVSIAFKRNSLEVSSPVKLSFRLFADVDTESCTWTYCPEGICVTLAKALEVAWPRLLQAQ